MRREVCCAVAHLLWERLSGVGERRSALEIQGFCVICVGKRRWASTQFLAQFGTGSSLRRPPLFGKCSLGAYNWTKRAVGVPSSIPIPKRRIPVIELASHNVDINFLSSSSAGVGTFLRCVGSHNRKPETDRGSLLIGRHFT